MKRFNIKLRQPTTEESEVEPSDRKSKSKQYRSISEINAQSVISATRSTSNLHKPNSNNGNYFSNDTLLSQGFDMQKLRNNSINDMKTLSQIS